MYANYLGLLLGSIQQTNYFEIAPWKTIEMCCVTKATVSIMHQEVRSESLRRVIVHAAGSVSDVAHYQSVRICKPNMKTALMTIIK